jgi:V8-like Glu-specific endopeptidase
MSDIFGALRELVADGDAKIATERLVNVLKGHAPDLANDAILMAARLARLARDRRSGVVDDQRVAIESARIDAALLQYIDELPNRLARRGVHVAREPSIEEMPRTDVDLERIFGVNHLKSIAWLQIGLTCARSVCRIVCSSGIGTGFLTKHGFIITNHHVIPDAQTASTAVVEFGFEEDLTGRLKAITQFKLAPQTFRSSEIYDVAAASLQAHVVASALSEWGALACEITQSPVVHDHVSIIQHPDGGPKMIALTANQVVNIDGYRLQYSTDTLPGSSGSPVFDDKWRVVAIHHAGGKLRRNVKGDRRFVNEGILAGPAVRALELLA